MKPIVMTVKLSEEEKSKLTHVAREKYRGTNLSQAIRWMIDDMWHELVKKEEKKIPTFTYRPSMDGKTRSTGEREEE